MFGHLLHLCSHLHGPSVETVFKRQPVLVRHWVIKASGQYRGFQLKANFVNSNSDISNSLLNERLEFMQETQHTQQKATRTAQTKTRKQHECKWLQNTEDTQKQTNIYLGKYGSTALERSVTIVTGGLNLVYERSTSLSPSCPIENEQCK